MILKSCCLETETGRGAHFRRLFAQELSVRKSRNGRHSQLILIGVAMGLPLKTPSRTVKLGFCGIGLKSALYSRVSLEFRRLRFQGLKQAQLIQNAWSQFARDVLHRPQEKSITPKMNQGAALDRLLEWGSLEFALRHAANPILTGTNWPIPSIACSMLAQRCCRTGQPFCFAASKIVADSLTYAQPGR